MEVNIQEAARIRGVSERRIDQQPKEGGWGIQKISRGRYVLEERGIDGIKPKGLILKTSKERLAYEKKLRSDLEDTEDCSTRATIIGMLAELELERVGPKIKAPEFRDEDRILNDTEIDWLINSACYQIGLISSEDLLAIAKAFKENFKLLKKIKDCKLSEMVIEDSLWRFMIVDCLLEMLEARDKRGDQRVLLAGNTGFRK